MAVTIKIKLEAKEQSSSEERCLQNNPFPAEKKNLAGQIFPRRNGWGKADKPHECLTGLE